MKRKHFLSTLLPAALTLSATPSVAESLWHTAPRSVKKPPHLQPGDTIGITSPASYITQQEIQPAVQLMQSWGFKVEVGKTIGQHDFTLGGTDQARAADMQYMLNSSHIKAIMCARGGYGVVRIVDQLDFGNFKREPKWVIGFSDITVLHNHIHHNCHIATIHSKMCNSFPDEWSKADAMQVSTIESIRQAITGQPMSYTAPASTFNRPGEAKGQLVGGNLTIVASLAASRSDISTRGKILFLEDTGEYLYNIDRMFYNLKRSGKLDHLAGLIIGGFRIKPDDPDEVFGRTLSDIVLSKVKEFDYPVCFDFPVGHQKNNFALKCGVKHVLKVGQEGSTLAIV